MKIESIVVSLDTAKKLKAAGWDKPTAFYWSDLTGIGNLLDARYMGGKPFESDMPAPTAEEILRELPQYVKHTRLFIFPFAKPRCWAMVYGSAGLGKRFVEYRRDSLAEAAAQMWLWCKKNNYLEAIK